MSKCQDAKKLNVFTTKNSHDFASADWITGWNSRKCNCAASNVII